MVVAGSPSRCLLLVEGDETYVGGKAKNKPLSQRRELTGRGPAGKAIVVGAKDRATKRISASVVTATENVGSSAE